MIDEERLFYKNKITKIICNSLQGDQEGYPSWAVGDLNVDEILYCPPANFGSNAWFKITTLDSLRIVYINSYIVATVEAEETDG